jgi:hypothetical protein
MDQYVTSGLTEGGISYLILKKYGLSLFDMLQKSKFQRFTIKTAVQIGL